MNRFLLQPLSWLIYGASQLRKKWILSNPLQIFPVPIIIVGNISVGGTGKTPFVCALVEELKRKGYKPGVVSRGYKAQYSSEIPYLVTSNELAQNVGDEPLLIATKTHVPVVICKDRPKAVQYLLEQFPEVDVVISDDGLQHYRLHRDVEIVLMNEPHKHSHLLFPAGPLREPFSRLKSVDFVVSPEELNRSLKESAILLHHPEKISALNNFRHKTIYAVAGIAHPERFFRDLKAQGFNVIECPYPDHYEYTESDFKRFLDYAQHGPVFMTEKDAVKFKKWKEWDNTNIWVVSLVTTIAPDLIDKIINKMTAR